jgi:hypothetical protein
VEECLEKINRTIRTLMDVDSKILDGDSYLYVRLQIVAISNVLKEIQLCMGENHRMVKVEIKDDKYFCLHCESRRHMESNCNRHRRMMKVWHPKKKLASNILTYFGRRMSDGFGEASDVGLDHIATMMEKKVAEDRNVSLVVMSSSVVSPSCIEGKCVEFDPLMASASL